MTQVKMICPDCGVEMNRHAVKVDYGEDSVPIDPDFEGVLKEIHTCPRCGRVDERLA